MKLSIIRHPASASLAFLFLWLSGCGGAEVTAQSWQLDRLRILAVRAEPAEPTPGALVHFERLVFVPSGAELQTVLWVACMPRGPEVECELEPELEQELLDADLDALSEEELADLLDRGKEAGLFGLEPVTEPVIMVPPIILEQLDPDEQSEGINLLVQLWAVTPDPADVELAVKRIPVSLASTPNHNPDLLGWRVDGTAIDGDGAVNVSAGEQITLEPILAKDAIETYDYVSEAGETEERLEEPYYAWYTEEGSFDRHESLASDGAVTWTAPESEFAGVILCVVRDRRGGMDWLQLDVTVE